LAAAIPGAALAQTSVAEAILAVAVTLAVVVISVAEIQAAGVAILPEPLNLQLPASPHALTASTVPRLQL
jgi:hypothetical protein